MSQINPSLAEKNQHVQYKLTYLTLQPNKAIGTENAYIQQSVMACKQN